MRFCVSQKPVIKAGIDEPQTEVWSGSVLSQPYWGKPKENLDHLGMLPSGRELAFIEPAFLNRVQQCHVYLWLNKVLR